MALLCALLAGDNRSVDALTATLASLSVPSVLSTIEDFMWCKLTLVGGAVASAAQVTQGGSSGRDGGRGGERVCASFGAAWALPQPMRRWAHSR